MSHFYSKAFRVEFGFAKVDEQGVEVEDQVFLGCS